MFSSSLTTYFLSALQWGTAAVVLGALVWVFACHTRVGIALLLSPGLIDELTRQKTPSFDVGALTFSVSDVITVCAVTVITGRLIVGRIRLSRGTVAAAGLLTLATVSVLRGAGEFGLEHAVNECRPYAFFLAAALYVATADARVEIARFIAKAWCILAVTYALVAISRWRETGFSSANENIVVDGALVTARPVFAAAALVIGQAALLLIAMRLHTLRHRLLAVGLLLAVLLLQHRTVWIATAIAIAAYLLLGRAVGTERFAVFGATVCAGVIGLVGFSMFSLGPVKQDILSSYSTMQGTHSTFAWRVAGWNGLLGQKDTFVDLLVGRPFGTGYARLIDGNLVTVSPHNFYIQTFLRLGIAGLVLLVGLYLWILLNLRSGSRTDLLGRLILLTQLTFCFAYSPSMEQGAVLGIILWQLNRIHGNRSRQVPLSGRNSDGNSTQTSHRSPHVHASSCGRPTGGGPRQRDLSLGQGLSRQP
ncbi:hypothetical protein [Streptomyces sp. MK5]|uniref:hypothetical protein n=1 Tax=Streptomyces sp. MK5 TaxID=3064253 RepID=UPI002742108E|nr:hypothetical protein [Streptomyces sp. MK5]